MGRIPDISGYLIPCEGSGCNGNRVGWTLLGCQMCGHWFDLRNRDEIGSVPQHHRVDDLRMISDGVFDDLTYADGLELAAEAKRLVDHHG